MAAGCLAAYVGNPDASVLDSVRLSGFGVSYTTDGVYHASEVLPDGTSVVVNRVSAFDLPPGVSFAMRSQSGVCFEDGAAPVPPPVREASQAAPSVTGGGAETGMPGNRTVLTFPRHTGMTTRPNVPPTTVTASVRDLPPSVPDTA